MKIPKIQKYKIQEALQTIVSAVVVFIGVVGMLLFFYGFNATAFNLIIISTGLGMMGAAFLVFKYVIGRELNSFKSEKIIDDYKNTAPIPIDLTTAIIKENKWESKVSRNYSSKMEALNYIGGNEELNYKTVSNVSSTFEVKQKVNGRTRTFHSEPIATDKATLMIKLELKKTGILHVNLNRPSKYY